MTSSEQFAIAQFLKAASTQEDTVVYVCKEAYSPTNVNLLEEDMSRHYCYLRPSYTDDGEIDTVDIIQAAKSPYHLVLHDRLIYRYDVDGELLELSKKLALEANPQSVFPSQSDEVKDMVKELCGRLFAGLMNGHLITDEEIAEIDRESNSLLEINEGEAAIIGRGEEKNLYYRERSSHFERVKQRRLEDKDPSQLR
jgi:hypothetical protein